MRGRAANNGATMVAQNGYHYTKVDGKWKLTHHIIAEERLLGRPLNPDERVVFVNGRTNLNTDNIRVVKKGRQSLKKRLAQLEARRDELDAQIGAIKSEINRQDRLQAAIEAEAQLSAALGERSTSS